MLNIAGFEKESFVDGDGVRYTVFVQGCKHNCYKCHNPETHDFNCGKDISVDDIFNDIKNRHELDGVTFSGGDPFYQAHECAELAERVKNELHKDVWAYTGYVFEELLKSEDAGVHEFLKHIDVLVDGPYVDAKRSLALSFRGSSNQRLIDVEKSLQEGNVVLYKDE